MRKILNKIFRSRQGIGQLLFAGLGFVIGLLLLLISVHLYFKINEALAPRKAQPNYVIITKKVNLSNTLFLGRSDFGTEEINELSKQGFVEKVGAFTSNQFEVMAYSRQINFMTELFFESVPDEFLDIVPEDWAWKENSVEIPVVLSREMLDLYNFGFALGKTLNNSPLPQLSESTAKLLSVSVRIKGAKGEMNFRGRIVGFSQRIPSIIVPISFMNWANENLGEGKKIAPSRLILKVRNPNDPQLAKYFESKNYQINEDRLNASRAGAVVQIVMSIIAIMGTLFIGLSFVVFLMNFRVILAEAKQEIQLLLQLGYTVSIIAGYLISYFLIFIGILSVLTFGVLYFSVDYANQFLIDRGLNISAGIEPLVILVAFIFIGLNCLLNILAVLRLLNKYA